MPPKKTDNRGGKRSGAGRPTGSGRYAEPTINMRIPVSQVEQVQTLLSQHTKPPAQKQAKLASIDASKSLNILPAVKATDAMHGLAKQGIYANTVILDPWYRKRNSRSRPSYIAEGIELMHAAAKVADHVFVWGYPESVARLVDYWPSTLVFREWLTWYYKNVPTQARGWRPSQQACLHLSKPNAPVYPENLHTGNGKQSGRYNINPYSVIEAASLVGVVGKDENRAYPGQKPEAVFRQLILMTTMPGDLVIDPTCGTGTTGKLACNLGRRAILSDASSKALRITRDRLPLIDY